ncbi:uncharacterized protein LOC119675273 [Teleopsis dalmanni]|uniref:uncharacterized protein LOC119675273 n=1 Tax=Teleopsis dalmanni TaxID=139649 RepID=UPI0018CD6842|nr:uncharacterized protein LOC119675273 [Teleopsis dalmanni]
MLSEETKATLHTRDSIKTYAILFGEIEKNIVNIGGSLKYDDNSRNDLMKYQWKVSSLWERIQQKLTIDMKENNLGIVQDERYIRIQDDYMSLKLNLDERIQSMGKNMEEASKNSIREVLRIKKKGGAQKEWISFAAEFEEEIATLKQKLDQCQNYSTFWENQVHFCTITKELQEEEIAALKEGIANQHIARMKLEVKNKEQEEEIAALKEEIADQHIARMKLEVKNELQEEEIAALKKETTEQHKLEAMYQKQVRDLQKQIELSTGKTQDAGAHLQAVRKREQAAEQELLQKAKYEMEKEGGKTATKSNNKIAPIIVSEGVQRHFFPPAAPHFGGTVEALKTVIEYNNKRNSESVQRQFFPRVAPHFGGMWETEVKSIQCFPRVAPHFGGMWEAGGKSLKYYLKRVIGETNLAYEEMSTLLHQIEAVLNSRPLYQQSDGVGEDAVLIPAHFLIEKSLLSIPEPIPDGTISNWDRWKPIQKLIINYWKKWKVKYLVTQENYKKRQIARNELSHPAKWPMGQIEENISKHVSHISTTEDKKKPPKLRKGYNILMYFFALLWLSTGNAEVIHGGSVNELGIDTLYMGKIGIVDHVSTSWNLIVYYNMRPYFKTADHMKSLMMRIKELESKLAILKEDKLQL